MFLEAIKAQEKLENIFEGRRRINKVFITEEQKQKMWELFSEQGWRKSQIAHHMNVEVMTVMNALRRYTGRSDRHTKYE